MFPDEIDRLFQILETLELIIESKILFRGKFGSCQHQKTINNVKTNTTKHSKKHPKQHPNNRKDHKPP